MVYYSVLVSIMQCWSCYCCQEHELFSITKKQFFFASVIKLLNLLILPVPIFNVIFINISLVCLL